MKLGSLFTWDTNLLRDYSVSDLYLQYAITLLIVCNSEKEHKET